MDWLTDNLKEKTKQIFEKRYKRKLSDFEIEEIVINLVTFFETVIKTKDNLTSKNISKS